MTEDDNVGDYSLVTSAPSSDAGICRAHPVLRLCADGAGACIIFGRWASINMAHGEFMILGAYVTWMTSNAVQHVAPWLFPGYFFIAMILDSSPQARSACWSSGG